MGLLVALLAATACKKEPAAPAKDDLQKPLAIVGSDSVKVEDAVNYMKAANLDRTLASRDAAIEDLIAVHLVKAAAKEQKRTPEQEALREEWEGQLKMSQFRDSVIQKTVAVPDSAVEAFYKERVGEEIKARHILVAVPPTATADDKAAARARAEEALKKARAGGDFEKLSREYSEPKTAATGGDLGWFGKGAMVPQFERAAFALSPGEISDVVETRFGFHVIKLEDRRKKTLDEVRPDIEKALSGPLKQQAEERYIEKMMSESGLNLYEANVDTLIAIFKPDSVGALSPARAALPIAKWDKGQVTIGDIVELFRTLPRENQAAVKSLDRDRMLSALTPLVRNRMLLARAEAASLKLDSERRKQLDEKFEAVVVSDMLRNQVKADAAVTDAELKAAWASDSATTYAGKTFAQAEHEIKKALLDRKMAQANSQAGQRELVHELASKVEGKVKVERFKQNYELVLKELAPADSAAKQARQAGAAGAVPPAAAGAGAEAGSSVPRGQPTPRPGVGGSAGGRPGGP